MGTQKVADSRKPLKAGGAVCPRTWLLECRRLKLHIGAAPGSLKLLLRSRRLLVLLFRHKRLGKTKIRPAIFWVLLQVFSIVPRQHLWPRFEVVI
jgi:hypothetical protein